MTLLAKARSGGTLGVLAALLLLASSARASAPYMGVDTWYAYNSNIDESVVVKLADATVRSGLRALGYRYVWLDAGWWEGARDSQGNIVVDPAQWPRGLGWLAAYIHSRGLRAGIYTETGDNACKNGGALGHVQQDIDAFAAWGFDALKADYCGDLARLHRDPRVVYGEFAQAIRNDRPRRRILLNVTNADVWSRYKYTAFASWTFAPRIAGSWRTSGDLSWPGHITFAHVLRNIDDDARHPDVAGHGHWNDPDYLTPTMLPASEAQTQVSMWAILAAPMMVSADIPSLSPRLLRMIGNREVLAISQDPRGVQGRAVGHRGHVEVWVKPLVRGARAVALLNRGRTLSRVELTGAMIGLTGRLVIRDVWAHAATRASRITVTVGPHGTALFRVRALG
jgi:alpha-galactosidase